MLFGRQVDSEMCKTSISHKIELAKQLEVVLQGSVKPMITQCCIHELYLQGKTQQSAVDLAKTFERRKCNHREAISGDDCLKSVVGDINKHRYAIATQSQELRTSLRAIPAVPVVHVNRSVMVLEPPSQATLDAKTSVEETALYPSTSEITALPSSVPAEQPRKKKKGPKGPNPLSVKKKIVKSDPSSSLKRPRAPKPNESEVGSKRKRMEASEAVDNQRVTSESGHKRKRRRKAHLTPDTVETDP
ncbi:uncharacterized protein FIBRA_02995 [Fibroporia radiculosa]|uniref:U three protein 23 n=1 Tax=Fibroporia radiculosa TaxID=599839 RepID=J4G3R6_9APHY|nr:uncharacterized protein FIBRA_02995 [Fibroporia radiculosa]CCM00948.1 predicted protein [Fibroporia radiculosa]